MNSSIILVVGERRWFSQGNKLDARGVACADSIETKDKEKKEGKERRKREKKKNGGKKKNKRRKGPTMVGGRDSCLVSAKLLARKKR